MKPTAISLMVITAFALVIGIIPTALMAGEIIVNPSDPTCSSTTTPPCYKNITAAINEANNIYSANTASFSNITVEAGTYNETITLQPGVSSLRGRETARTILNGGGGGTVVTASGVTSASVANFTIINAAVGISVSNTSSITITNNIFKVGTSGIAVQVQSAPSARITNNIFFQNGTAVSSNSDILITNNIFSNNTTAVANSSPIVTFAQLSYNSFFSNNTDATNGQTSSTNVIIDPKFVDVGGDDFHLLSSSPCINVGNPDIQYNNPTSYPNHPNDRNDMGAYGGPNTDIVPFRVVSRPNVSTNASNQIILSWNPNNSYLVSGYRVYYGNSPGDRHGSGATEGPSPLNATTTTNFTVSGLSTTVPVPASPQITQKEPRDRAIKLSWSPVDLAKSYKIYYGTTSPPTVPVATVDATSQSYTVTNLTNGTLYYFAVTAVNEATYYFAVTALNSGGTGTPGVAYESIYSDEQKVTLGSAVESLITPSYIVSDFPEMLTAYPSLPNGNQGCFIATAAYGQYSAPEVRVLRAFRDRYLLTSGPGRAFVGWYYRYSPAAAAALNAHPWLKPVVRLALAPAVGGAFLLNRSPLLFLACLSIVFGCAALLLFRQKKFSRFGGNR